MDSRAVWEPNIKGLVPLSLEKVRWKWGCDERIAGTSAEQKEPNTRLRRAVMGSLQ